MSKESRTNSSTLIVMFVFVILIILVNIKVPTLFTVGEFDEISVHVVKGLAEKVPDARFVMFPGSSHMTPWDARDESIKVVREFLNSDDSLNNKVDR